MPQKRGDHLHKAPSPSAPPAVSGCAQSSVQCLLNLLLQFSLPYAFYMLTWGFELQTKGLGLGAGKPPPASGPEIWDPPLLREAHLNSGEHRGEREGEEGREIVPMASENPPLPSIPPPSPTILNIHAGKQAGSHHSTSKDLFRSLGLFDV